MRKFFSIALASLLIVSSLASCGSTETETSSGSSGSEAAEVKRAAETTEAETEEETTEEETTEAETEEETTEADTDDDDEISDDELEITTIAMPELVPDDAAEGDFIGKWEASKMIADGIYMEDFMGIPLGVMMQLEIKDDYTAVVASTLEDTDVESMTWEYTDNGISILDENGEATSCIIMNGELVLYGEEDGAEEQVYFTKVDEFTQMSEEELQALMEEAFGSLAEDIDVPDTDTEVEDDDTDVEEEITDTAE